MVKGALLVVYMRWPSLIMCVGQVGKWSCSLAGGASVTVRRIAALTFIIESGHDKHVLIFSGPLEKRKAFVPEFEAACQR